MDRRKPFSRSNVGNISCILCTAFASTMLFCADPAEATEYDPSGVMRITVQSADRAKMPAAFFRHDRHVSDVREKGGDCSVCHTRLADPAAAPGKDAFAFVDVAEGGKAMDAWHAGCLKCHEEQKDAPQAASCRSCHDAKAPAAGQEKVVFDLSLHAVHTESKHIAPVAEAPGANGEPSKCGVCHYTLDPASGKRVYAKSGESVAPVYGKDDPAQAHEKCVACHLETAKTADKALNLALPTDCAACHSSAGQAKFPKKENPPRLMDGQPDTVLLGEVTKKAAAVAGVPEAAALKPVLFNHKSHEKAVVACATCHVNGIEKKTGEAPRHLNRTDEKGAPVSAYAAAHAPDSDTSCVGCHIQYAKETPSCAGCHAGMKLESKNSCAVCHSGEQGAQAVKAPAPADIPETVTIDALSKDYGPVTLPHRKIYEKLLAGMGDNALASAFHVPSACGACHHNIPDQNLANPPKCGSCHEKEIKAVSGNKDIPNLKAAYHQQCIGCHASMDVKPAAADCAGCHKPKKQELTTASVTKNQLEVK